ncbi:MAG: ATP synthase F1 subunit epsilon [Phascolarctobacterium sp.]|nr:ATP synthase F1 subunit epsilon [Candidatus Phascolarctobacterium caballi]
MATPFSFEIVTPDKMLFSTNECVYIGFKTPVGSMGIENKHEPITASLTVAPLDIKLADGKWKHFAVCGGFLEMNGEKATVLATVAEDGKDIDIARANEAKKRAEDRLASKSENIDVARAKAALDRALMRLRTKELVNGKSI